MPEFVSVAKVSQLPEGGKLLVCLDERMLVLVRISGEYFCIDDVCTHDGGPLGEGGLDPQQHSLACPRHGAKFDIRTGRPLSMPATEATVVHEIRVSGDDIQVKLRDND